MLYLILKFNKYFDEAINLVDSSAVFFNSLCIHSVPSHNSFLSDWYDAYNFCGFLCTYKCTWEVATYGSSFWNDHSIGIIQKY